MQKPRRLLKYPDVAEQLRVQGEVVYGAVTDNWPTLEPYFNETGSNCPSNLPRYALHISAAQGCCSMQVCWAA